MNELNELPKERTFQDEAPMLIGSLTFLIQSILKDLKDGDKSRVKYYEERLSKLSKLYPNSFFPELLNIAKP